MLTEKYLFIILVSKLPLLKWPLLNEKDIDNKENLLGIVYLMKCKGCKKFYTGETADDESINFLIF